MQTPRTKILIVEDEPAVLDVCGATLRRRGFDCILTKNGVQALEVYRGRHEEIALVISDIAMPSMGGIELLRNVFEIYEHASVIMMSGCHWSEIIPDHLGRLCSVLEKPFTPAMLIEAVEKCLLSAKTSYQNDNSARPDNV